MAIAPRDAAPLPRTLRVYLLIAAFLGVGAVAGGTALLADPSGETIGLSTEWLEGSPFGDYLLPGAVLFVLFGIGSFVVCASILRRRRWSGVEALGLGVALLTWLGVQIAIIDRLSWLHALYAGIGLALVVLATRPASRAALRTPDR